MREYKLELLDKLGEGWVIDENGVEIKIKSIPDDSRKGADRKSVV